MNIIFVKIGYCTWIFCYEYVDRGCVRARVCKITHTNFILMFRNIFEKTLRYSFFFL